MVTCHITYHIDPYQLDAFEHYARLWIPLVNRLGGQHHGYFLPSEGANHTAYALFTFPSLKEYEQYRKRSFEDDECKAAFEYARQTRCIVSLERTFLKPEFGNGAV